MKMRSFRIKSSNNFKVKDIVRQIELAANDEEFNGQSLYARYDAQNEELVIEYEVW